MLPGKGRGELRGRPEGRGRRCDAATRARPATAAAQTHPRAAGGGARRPWPAARQPAAGARLAGRGRAPARTGARMRPGERHWGRRMERRAGRPRAPGSWPRGRARRRGPGTGRFPRSSPPVPPPSDGPRAPAHLEHLRRWSARRWPCRPRTFAASPGPRWPWRRRDGPRSLPPGPRTVAGPAPRRCPRPAPRVRSPVGGAGRGGQCGREAIPGPGPMTRGGIPTARESATSVPPGHVVSVQQTRRSNGQPVPAVQGLLSPTCSQALQVRYRRPLPCRAPPSICSCRPACLF